MQICLDLFVPSVDHFLFFVFVVSIVENHCVCVEGRVLGFVFIFGFFGLLHLFTELINLSPNTCIEILLILPQNKKGSITLIQYYFYFQDV